MESIAFEYGKKYAIESYSFDGYGIAYFLNEGDAVEFEYLVRREGHCYNGGIFDGLPHGRRPKLDDETFLGCLKIYATSFDPYLFGMLKRDSDVE